MANLLASILLPTYNRAYCLASVIDSILGQTYSTFELLIVDDGSTDATANLIADKYAGERRIRYHRRPNGGVSAARNSAIELAKGEVLVFSDSDDVWLQHKLMMQIATFVQFPDVNLVWTDVSAVDPSGKVLHERYTRVCYPAWHDRPIDEVFDRSRDLHAVCPLLPPGFQDRRVYVGNIFQTMIVGTLINMPTVAVRSRVIAQAGNFNETMVSGGDYDFNLRACGTGPVAFIDVPTVLYRIGAADQLTRPSLHADQAKNWFRAVTPFLEGGRIPAGLTRQRLRDILAGKYGWLGMAELLCGNRRAARAALWQSLHRSPRQAKRWMYFLATFFPSAVEESLRTVYRRIKPRAV